MEINDAWLKQGKNLLDELKQIVAEGTCNKPKDIGDRVIIEDGFSFIKDFETGEIYFEGHEILKNPFIIIEKDCKNEVVTHYGDKLDCDIVVYSPKYKSKIATCMVCVRRLD